MFSNHERKVVKILGTREMTVSNVTKVFYDERKMPLQGDNYIAGVIRNVTKKCEFYNLDWTINGDGAGRAGRTVWKTKRGNKMKTVKELQAELCKLEGGKDSISMGNAREVVSIISDLLYADSTLIALLVKNGERRSKLKRK